MRRTIYVFAALCALVGVMVMPTAGTAAVSQAELTAICDDLYGDVFDAPNAEPFGVCQIARRFDESAKLGVGNFRRRNFERCESDFPAGVSLVIFLAYPIRSGGYWHECDVVERRMFFRKEERQDNYGEHRSTIEIAVRGAFLLPPENYPAEFRREIVRQARR